MIRMFLALICAIVSAALVIYSVCIFAFKGGQGNMEGSKTACFRYFTVDSNLLAACSSLIVALCIVLGYIPQWALLLHFTGTVSVMLTFLTVVFFLGPTKGYAPMFEGTNLFFHLIVPLFSAASLLLMWSYSDFPFAQSLWGLLPMIVYGAVYTYLVMGKKIWPDFYGFVAKGNYFVPIALMLASTTAICAGLWALCRVCCIG